MNRPPALDHLPPVIALCGYAGAGKDVLATHLVDAGYERHNFGTPIKRFFDPFVRGEQSPAELRKELLAHLSSKRTEADVDLVMLRHAPVVQALRNTLESELSAFTEDRFLKPSLRPLLEFGGELIYDYVFNQYFARLQELIEAGKRVVNTRLCKLPEARAWQLQRGAIYAVCRFPHQPSTQWDHDVMVALHSTGHIDHIFLNAALSGDAWHDDARRQLEALL